MPKKIIIILVIVLIILLIIVSLLRKNVFNSTPLSTNSIMPTSITSNVGNLNMSLKNNQKNNGSNMDIALNNQITPNKIVPTEIIPSTNTGEDDLALDKQINENFSYLTLSKNTPLETDDFTITFNSSTKKFEVSLKNGANSQEKFRIWTIGNGFTNYDLSTQFIIFNGKQEITDFKTSSDQSKKSFIDLLEGFFSLSNIKNSSGSVDLNVNQNNYGSPNNKNYYNNQTDNGRCDSPSKYIQVYADNAIPNTCYSNIKAIVESKLTRVELLGHNVSVHKDASGYFKKVNEELAPFKVSGDLYKFAQGEYRFSSVGTYNFRCNVNASSSRDLCSSQCILSTHAFGISVDINPATNCNGCDKFDMPPEAVSAFEKNGFRWGGRYKERFGATIDAMHFEYLDAVCK